MTWPAALDRSKQLDRSMLIPCLNTVSSPHKARLPTLLVTFLLPLTGGTFQPIPVREFPAHVMHLHANDDFLFSEEYSSVEPDHAPTAEVCLRPENQSKNRYANIKAYDHSRVILKTSDPHSNYINANRLDVR